MINFKSFMSQRMVKLNITYTMTTMYLIINCMGLVFIPLYLIVILTNNI